MPMVLYMSAGLALTKSPGPSLLFKGGAVIEWTIACGSCQRSWKAAATYSIYERQAVESRPCPACAAYTLCCRGPAEEPVLLKVRRRQKPRRTGALAG